MTRNQDVAGVLYEIAQILEIQEVAFKPRAYRRAAMNIENLGEDIEQVIKEERLREIPGVGEAIAEKIIEFVKAGKLPYLEKLRKELPKGVLEIMAIPGVGPKTALRLQKELKVHSVDDLERAVKAGRLEGLKGIKEKSQKEILDGISRIRAQPSRVPYPTALETAQDIIKLLNATGHVEQVEFAGSLRRGRDTVGDVDLLAIAPPKDAEKVVEAFTKYRDASQVLEKGSTRTRILLKAGLQVDLRIVARESYGAALQYFTGSKEHNIALRTLALKKGWTINEYALSRKKDGKRIAGETEEEIYAKLGLAMPAPELRENLGEIEAAKEDKLPKLVTLEDIRGDLHTHTTESDGHASAERMVETAKGFGYAWYGISDHSKGLGIARGLDQRRYAAQRKNLARLQKKFSDVTILQGAEVNIRKDGELDLDAKTLASLDYVIGSVHSSFDLGAKEQTARVLKALDAGVDILAHPSTRLLGQRGEIQVDWEKVFDRAKARGTSVEVNASPFRLDLNAERARRARERGLLAAINTDAHTASGLGWMSFGLVQARRAGFEARQVLTALPLGEVRRHLGHAQGR